MKTKIFLPALFIIFALLMITTSAEAKKPKRYESSTNKILQATSRVNNEAVKRGRKNVGLENTKLVWYNPSFATTPAQRARLLESRIKKMQKENRKARKG